MRLCRRVRKKWSIRSIISVTTIRAARRCPPGRVLDGIPPVLVVVIKFDRDAGRENERRFAVGGEPELGVPGPVVHDHRRVVGDPHYSLSLAAAAAAQRYDARFFCVVNFKCSNWTKKKALQKGTHKTRC